MWHPLNILLIRPKLLFFIKPPECSKSALSYIYLLSFSSNTPPLILLTISSSSVFCFLLPQSPSSAIFSFHTSSLVFLISIFLVKAFLNQSSTIYSSHLIALSASSFPLSLCLSSFLLYYLSPCHYSSPTLFFDMIII